MKSRAPSYVLITAALASGCQSPAPLRNPSEITRTPYSLREEPLRAAACIARNVDRYRSPYSAHIRPGAAPAIAEVIVTGREIVSTVQLFASGDASTALVVTAPVEGRDDLVAAMIEGC